MVHTFILLQIRLNNLIYKSLYLYKLFIIINYLIIKLFKLFIILILFKLDYLNYLLFIFI